MLNQLMLIVHYNDGKGKDFVVPDFDLEGSFMTMLDDDNVLESSPESEHVQKL